MTRRLAVPASAVVAVLLATTSGVAGGAGGVGVRGHRVGGAGLQAVAPRGFRVGAAVQTRVLQVDRRYRRAIAGNLGIVTPENEMKWGTIHPSRDRYDFGPADAIVAFARRHHLQVRGHNLAWWIFNPSWLEEGRFTRTQLRSILRRHVGTVVGHYRGRIAQWDVVNEAVGDDGVLRPGVWGNGIGAGYIAEAFRAARVADPRAKLFYNDYGIEAPGSKADAVYRLVRDLKRRGVPIDGVGLQVHAEPGLPTGAQLSEQLRRYRKLGLDTAVTELDVRVPVPATAAVLAQQAAAFRDLGGACVHEPSCRTLVMWGLTDRYSWIPQFFSGKGAALVLDENYRPKPAYRALRRALEETGGR